MAKEEVKTVDVNAAKMKALQATIDKIEKDFGKGTIMKLGEQPEWDVQVIPSGSVALDHALGVGGYPRGRIIEIYGPESSGKTTLAIHAIAEAQKLGGIAAMIDAEHAFDRTYAKALGVNLDALLISQPDNGEQALEIADNLIRSGAIDIVVIDSVAALTPKAEIEGEMGDNKVGLQARLMSQALRKLTANISKTNTCCIFINQLREKIGVMFGNPRAATPSSSTLPSAWTCGAPPRSRTATKPPATARASRSSRTRWPRRSRRRNSTSSSARASATRRRLPTWRSNSTSSTRAAAGSATRARSSPRARRP